MADLEESIREHAYHMWMAEGCPQGRCETFWLSAERQLLADRIAAVAASTHAVAAPKKAMAKKSVAAKKKRAA